MEHDGLWVATRPDVYEPSDDTFLLAAAVRDHVRPSDRFLEVGCGAGLVALTAARGGAHVTATDKNPQAVALTCHNARENRLQARIQAVEADLLETADGLLEGPFDVVAFNPPYLPTEAGDRVEGVLNLAFDGGPDGNAVVLRFARQVGQLATRPRLVLVVHSSLSDPGPLDAALGEAGYEGEEEREERFFFEKLAVRAYRRPSGG